MDTFTPVPPPAPASEPPPREGWAVGAGRGADWWLEGWRLFAKSPWIWIAIGLVACLIMLVLGQIPFLGSLATSLLSCLLAGGVLQGARDLDRGGLLRFAHLFAGFGEKAKPLIALGLLIFAASFLIGMIAIAVLIGLVGFGTLTSLLAGSGQDVGLGMIVGLGMGALVAALLAMLLFVPLAMATWFAPALVLFRGDDPFGALKASFAASLRNMPPFLVYGVIGLVLAIVASIPFALGWLVLMPVVGTSIYASYKDVFGAP
jgi:hypothetical protein